MTIPVRVGVGIAAFAPFEPGSWWGQIELMEELGYDSVWLPDSSRLGGPAPLVALAAAAARTRRLKLGMNVLALPARNPVLLARELATLDVLSGGRMLPAGGLGTPAEIAAAGVARAERAARLEESVAVLRALWTGRPVTHRGRFWTFEDVTLVPRPTRPKLELWLGATVPAALERLARIGDGWLAAGVAPEDFRAACDLIRAAARDAGRSIDEDHYGANVVAAPLAADVPAGLSGARGLEVVTGAGALRTRLEAYVAAGASKFVVLPVARDPQAWLRELHAEVVAPLEADAAVG